MKRNLPEDVGLYYWSEWDRVVRVYRNTPSGPLWVRVYEHWQPLRITPRIAGHFTPHVDTPPVYSSTSST